LREKISNNPSIGRRTLNPFRDLCNCRNPVHTPWAVYSAASLALHVTSFCANSQFIILSSRFRILCKFRLQEA
jgi:hypothetical protein